MFSLPESSSNEERRNGVSGLFIVVGVYKTHDFQGYNRPVCRFSGLHLPELNPNRKLGDKTQFLKKYERCTNHGPTEGHIPPEVDIARNGEMIEFDDVGYLFETLLELLDL